MRVIRPVAVSRRPGALNQESWSGCKSRPSAFRALGDRNRFIRGMEPEGATISCSEPPSTGTRNRLNFELSLELITSWRPEGSAVTLYPARILRGSPPEEGTAQMTPPAALYKIFPSGEEASDTISPLLSGILRVMRPLAVSAT